MYHWTHKNRVARIRFLATEGIHSIDDITLEKLQQRPRFVNLLTHRHVGLDKVPRNLQEQFVQAMISDLELLQKRGIIIKCPDGPLIYDVDKIRGWEEETKSVNQAIFDIIKGGGKNETTDPPPVEGHVLLDDAEQCPSKGEGEADKGREGEEDEAANSNLILALPPASSSHGRVGRNLKTTTFQREIAHAGDHPTPATDHSRPVAVSIGITAAMAPRPPNQVPRHLSGRNASLPFVAEQELREGVRQLRLAESQLGRAKRQEAEAQRVLNELDKALDLENSRKG